MNRENKRKTFEKGYYKTHACNDTFTCKVCGRVFEYLCAVSLFFKYSLSQSIG